MPIPKPKITESRRDFIERCMGDTTMVDEYSDTSQRSAVCNSSYESYKEESLTNEKEEIREDVFTTEEEALERANEIGCEGTHTHDADGQLVFMPCSSHADYTRLTGRELSGYGMGKKPKRKKPKMKNDCGCDEIKDDFIDYKTEFKGGHLEDEENEDYGKFEGYGSIFGNKDLGNDVIEQGAFLKSLKNKKPNQVKLLYQHKTDMPIGVFDEIREDEKGLFVKGRLALKTQAGAEAYELMKMGALDGLSIGFRVNPKEVEYDKRANKRIIKEVELMEVSLVTFPMNPKARVQSVKAQDITIREWESGLREAFNLSRSEAKVAAGAVHKSFDQREAASRTELLEGINNLTKTLKNLNY
jgi:HK97 family phage prohead protease